MAVGGETRRAEGCILWSGGTDGKAYGRAYVNGRGVQAHRQVWEQANGPLSDEMQLHHRCGTKLCINPEHLEPLTISEHSGLKGPENRKRRVSQRQLGLMEQLLDGPLAGRDFETEKRWFRSLLDTCRANGWVDLDRTKRPGRFFLTPMGREAVLNALAGQDVRP